MKVDFKNNIKSNIKSNDEVSVSNSKDDIKQQDNHITKTFKLGKKVDEKIVKKNFPVYMNVTLQKELDKICRKTGYSRNELINLMCEYCVQNLELLD
jgi:hypothetical protein